MDTVRSCVVIGLVSVLASAALAASGDAARGTPARLDAAGSPGSLGCCVARGERCRRRDTRDRCRSVGGIWNGSAACTPAGTCRPVHVDPPPCGNTLPTCNGACPGDQECIMRPIGGRPSCRCRAPSQCGDTYPACNGTCPPGESCEAQTIDRPYSCLCEPIHECGDSSPSCNGSCPAGSTCVAQTIDRPFTCQCQPVRECGDSSPACDGVCPPGQACFAQTIDRPATCRCEPLAACVPGVTQACLCAATGTGLKTCSADRSSAGTCEPDVGACRAANPFVPAGGGLSTWRHPSGTTLNHPRIHVIRWNDDPAYQDLRIAPAWNTFPDVLAHSRVYAAVLNNYVNGNDPGDAFSATLGASAIGTGDTGQGGVYLTDVDSVISDAIDNGSVPAPGSSVYDEFYFVLLPPYKYIHCGPCDAQHASFAKGRREAYFAAVQTGDGTGSTGIYETDDITRSMSHEYSEGVVDPICDTWYGGNCFTDEVGDKCEDLPDWHESGSCDKRNWVLAPIEHGGSCTQPVIGGQVCGAGGVPCTTFSVGDFHNQNSGELPWAVDWFYGSFKGECPPGMAVRGVSSFSGGGSMYYADRSYVGNIYEPFAHAVLCANDGGTPLMTFPKTSCTVRNISNGDDRGTTQTGDWDFGYWKAECALDEYVAGVSQIPQGRVTGILCCQSPYVSHSACAALNFSGGDAREPSVLTCDWDELFFKGECGVGRYVAGISADPNHNGGPNSILCCQ